jgi:hypothetical protein
MGYGLRELKVSRRRENGKRAAVILGRTDRERGKRT